MFDRITGQVKLMIRKVVGRSVQGASHIRSNTKCQDSHKIVLNDDLIIIAVADGHGSKSCPYSDSGSKMAVNTFCSLISRLYEAYADNSDQLITYLKRDGEDKIAKTIDYEWKEKVLKCHKRNLREIPKDEEGKDNLSAVYQQYGTTLLGLAIFDGFLFAFQLGDGDICYVTEQNVEMIICPEKILGVETHSLSKKDSWKSVITTVQRINIDQDLPVIFTLSSDGFSNSYKSETDFHNTLIEYLGMIKEHGLDAVEENLQGWLNETSEMGSGDDITLCIAFYSEEQNNQFPAQNTEESEIVRNEKCE